MVTREEVYSALGQVMDPEIHRPITELEMVKSVDIDQSGAVRVEVLLTIPGCPMKDRLNRDVTAAVAPLPGVTAVEVALGSMTEEQRQALVGKLRGPGAQQQRKITFWGDDSATRVLAVASGKGGVGKSSVTVNLAAALAAQGHRVAVVDCDIYGFSVPRMLGVSGRPVGFNGMIMPLEANGVKVISIGFFTDGRPVAWRGPMLHRAIQQFLADVYWGDLDYVLLDLPPGTGDVSISLAQMLPGSEMLLVTTPQEAAERAAARSWPATSAPSCSAGCRWTCACARAATAASRWWRRTRTPPPPRSCWRSPPSSPRWRGAWSASASRCSPERGSGAGPAGKALRRREDPAAPRAGRERPATPRPQVASGSTGAGLLAAEPLALDPLAAEPLGSASASSDALISSRSRSRSAICPSMSSSSRT